MVNANLLQCAIVIALTVALYLLSKHIIQGHWILMKFNPIILKSNLYILLSKLNQSEESILYIVTVAAICLATVLKHTGLLDCLPDFDGVVLVLRYYT